MVATSFSSNPSHSYDPSFINSVIATVLGLLFPQDLLSHKTNSGTVSGHLEDYLTSKISTFTSGSAQDPSQSSQQPEATIASTAPSVQAEQNIPPRSTVPPLSDLPEGSIPPSTPADGFSTPGGLPVPVQTADQPLPGNQIPSSRGTIPVTSNAQEDKVAVKDFAANVVDDISPPQSLVGREDRGSVRSLPRSLQSYTDGPSNPTVQRVPVAHGDVQETNVGVQPQTAAYGTGSGDDPSMLYHEAGEPADVPGQTGYDGSSIESTGRRPRRFPENHDMHGARYPVDPGRFDDAGSNDWGSMFSGWQAEVASLQQSLKSFQDSILLSLNSLDTRFDKLSGQLSEATTALTGFTGLPNQSAAPSNSFQPAALQTADPSAPIRPEESIRQVQFADQQGRPGSEQTVPNSNAPPAMAPQVTPDGMKHGQVGFAPLTGNEVTDTAQAVKGDQSISGGNGTAPRTQRAEGRHFWQRRP